MRTNGGRRHRRGRRRCIGAHYSGRWHGSPEKKTKGAAVQREDDDEGGYWTLMARPEAVGAAMPTTTVARPPFWLVTRVVTTGMARSGVLTDVNSCLPRSPSSVECYHGERSGRDKWR